MTHYWVLIAALFGAAIGSFLNVVVWRVPRSESINHPASHCPRCEHPIRFYDNIPVLSWVFLRGRCRDCGEPIAVRYPLVEAATAVAFAGIAWWALATGALGAATSPVQTVSFVLAVVAFLYLAAISIALALIDIDTRRLPNLIVLPAYLVGGVLLAAAALLVGDLAALLGAAIGAVAMFLAYFLMALAYPRGMGFGDVKLAGVLGLFLGFLGWGELAVGAFGAFFFGGIFGVALLLIRQAGRKTQIPFGPWMLVGAWVGIFVGRQLFGLYLGAFGLA